MLWASGLMAHLTPSSLACFHKRQSMSSRYGCALISMILLVFGGGFDDGGHVDRVAFAFQQQPARRMRQHRDPRMRQRLADALGHASAGMLKPLMHGGDDVIEQRQRLVVEIERAVGQDVALGAEEDAETFLRELRVELLDFLGLLADALLVEAVGLPLRFAVVGDAEVLQAEVHRGLAPSTRPSRCRHSRSSDSETCRAGLTTRRASAGRLSRRPRSRPCPRATRAGRNRVRAPCTNPPRSLHLIELPSSFALFSFSAAGEKPYSFSDRFFSRSARARSAMLCSLLPVK